LGHDAVHATELQLSRAADTQILSKALDEARVVITADLDFPRLLALLGAGGPGLILLRSGNYSEAESLECVRRVLMTIAMEELPQCIVVVDRKSIRRRWLPI
jgi:predicted nuclease of predicted toxin-antitoxin system